MKVEKKPTTTDLSSNSERVGKHTPSPAQLTKNDRCKLRVYI